MPVDYSKWATIVVSDSDDIDEETSSGQDGDADKSHQPQTKAAALDGPPEPAFAAEEPGREKIADICELVELLTGAFDNEVDQGKLATALGNAGCANRGLLLCQVDARRGKDYARFQKPVATQQNVPLCKKARQSQ